MTDETREYCRELVRELVDGIDAGDFSKEIIPDKYRWEHMLGLLLLKDELDGSTDLYRELFGIITRSAEN